ncbi:MAG: hypothetical protein BGO29_02665 [Bacteroidales bacterium 36-12]|nr:MAG: hypothetical protein BGO29_02665 [Bacteroidales bacterium 36-12]
MNKVICSRVDFISAAKIISQGYDSFQFSEGSNFSPLKTEQKPVYQCDYKKTDAGPLMEVSVKAIVKFNPDAHYFKDIIHGYVLRMYTDSGTFYFGHKDFPAKLEYTHNQVTASLTFSSRIPATVMK